MSMAVLLPSPTVLATEGGGDLRWREPAEAGGLMVISSTLFCSCEWARFWKVRDDGLLTGLEMDGVFTGWNVGDSNWGLLGDIGSAFASRGDTGGEVKDCLLLLQSLRESICTSVELVTFVTLDITSGLPAMDPAWAVSSAVLSLCTSCGFVPDTCSPLFFNSAFNSDTFISSM